MTSLLEISTFEEQGWTSGIMSVLKTVKICLTRSKKVSDVHVKIY